MSNTKVMLISSSSVEDLNVPFSIFGWTTLFMSVLYHCKLHQESKHFVF